jgi:hypothetical protein
MFSFEIPRPAIKPIYAPGHYTCRQTGMCLETHWKDCLWAFSKRRIERRSPISPNTKHPTPKSETLATDKEVGLQHSEVSLLEGWGQEPVMGAAVA